MNSHHIRNMALLLFGLLLGSCVSSSKPENNVDFTKIFNIQQLVGCYRNIGENKGSVYPRYLSAIIWPEPDKKNVDAGIDIVRVELISNNSLKITGESEGRILKERTVVDGKDFKIEAGKIILKSNLLGPSDIFIGVGHESSILGIDENGDGKLEELGGYLGTGLLFIPLAVVNKDSFRFSKLNGACEIKHANDPLAKPVN